MKNDLALLGGNKSLLGSIAPYNSIEHVDHTQAFLASHGQLSGYLGGIDKAGPFVEKLEKSWANEFGSSFAVACNSATSGLLMAAAAIDLGPGDEFIVSPYTMSATAAAPALLGAKPVFVDIEPGTCGLDPEKVSEAITNRTKAVFVTNLFGHPAKLKELRELCDQTGIYLVEDNAQSPFAMEGRRYTGTIGHIGVFSLNVHKHLQTGEGGVCVTNSGKLAKKLGQFMNHGEMAEGNLGLNLRMTEVTAAMALSQLYRSRQLVADRVRQAESLTAQVEDISWVKPLGPKKGDKSVYYHWAFDIEPMEIDRDTIHRALVAEGVPLEAGYVPPLYYLERFTPYAADCPVAEEKYRCSLLYFENCGYTLTKEQIKQVGKAFKKVDQNLGKLGKLVA